MAERKWQQEEEIGANAEKCEYAQSSYGHPLRNSNNLVKDEPVKSSSHGDSEENIGQISSIKQQKLQHGLWRREGQSNITYRIYRKTADSNGKSALPPDR